MKILVKSRRMVEKDNDVEVPHVVISIATPQVEHARVECNAYTRDILFMRFDDLEHEPAPGSATAAYFHGRHFHLFNRRHALDIIAFLERWRSVEAIVVHCEMGASRSPAIAAALAEHLYGMRTHIRDEYPGYNGRVYRIMRDALQER